MANADCRDVWGELSGAAENAGKGGAVCDRRDGWDDQQNDLRHFVRGIAVYAERVAARVEERVDGDGGDRWPPVGAGRAVVRDPRAGSALPCLAAAQGDGRNIEVRVNDRWR